jgi:hypothetical protein
MLPEKCGIVVYQEARHPMSTQARHENYSPGDYGLPRL